MSSWRCLKKSRFAGGLSRGRSQGKNIVSSARLGVLKTRHGLIQTPFFMPIATVGAVKTLTYADLKNLGASIILSNTYHLMLRPGADSVEKFGGLHKFMHWDRPILTDSGGYQVFSLAKMRKITDEGVNFQSHLDGRRWQLTPEKAMEIQYQLGSDIMMLLDECVGNPAPLTVAKKAVERTQNWAARQMASAQTAKARRRGQLVFGIVQGALNKKLRQQSARGLVALDCDGYAVGGLAVGEKPVEMYKILEATVPELPADKARYLMGVGRPEQIVEAVKRGIDMFDCVIPTREARHGRLYLWRAGAKVDISATPSRLTRPSTACPPVSRPHGNPAPWHADDFYETITITNQKFAADKTPINAASKFPELRNYSRAYLRHLFVIKEPLAMRLTTLNNVEFYLDLMVEIRWRIRAGVL